MQYFMLSPHNRFYTRFYAWALKLSFIYRIAITLLFVIITGTVWFYCIYLPNELAINQYQLDIVVLQNRGIANTILHKECMLEQKKIENLEKNIAPYLGVSTNISTNASTNIPANTTINTPASIPVNTYKLTDRQIAKPISISEEKIDTSSHLINIISYLHKAGMKLTVGSKGNLLDKGWYVKQVMHINAIGTMANIKDFFVQLCENKTMFSCPSFEISRIDNDRFSMSVDLSLFRPADAINANTNTATVVGENKNPSTNK